MEFPFFEIFVVCSSSPISIWLKTHTHTIWIFLLRSHKIRIKRFGDKLSHIKSSFAITFFTQMPSTIWKRSRAYEHPRGDELRLRKKHWIYLSLPPTFCCSMMPVSLWSLVWIPSVATAVVLGPAVSSHHQNSQILLCPNHRLATTRYQSSISTPVLGAQKILYASCCYF